MARALEKPLPESEAGTRTRPKADEPLRSLVRRAAQDAARRAATYREDTLVPGGGE